MTKEVIRTAPDLRRAMAGRKVYIDEYPHSHKHALQRHTEGEWDGLVVAWADQWTLKLEVLWPEWRAS